MTEREAEMAEQGASADISWAGYLLPEAVRREHLDDTLNMLARLNNRWDNRVTLKRLSPIEDYIKGRYNFILDIESFLFGKPEYYRAILHSAFYDIKLERPGFPDYVRERGEGVCEDKNSMLVENVEIVQSLEGVIPSSIRFQRADHIQDVGADVWTGLLYYSLKLGFKAIGGGSKGKASLVPLSTVHGHDVADHKIESCSEVMDRIPNQEGPFDRYPLTSAEYETGMKLVRSVGVQLQDKAIRVSVSECVDLPVKLSDVAFGPFNL